MHSGDIVYLPTFDGFIKYQIKRVLEDTSLLVITYKTHLQNWVYSNEVLTPEELNKIYKNECIYE